MVPYYQMFPSAAAIGPLHHVKRLHHNVKMGPCLSALAYHLPPIHAVMIMIILAKLLLHHRGPQIYIYIYIHCF